MADLEFKFGGDAKAAEAEITRLDKRIDKLTANLKHSGKTSRTVTDESRKGWRSFAADLEKTAIKAAGVNLVFKGISASIRGAMAENTRFGRQLQEVADKAQQEELKLQIQGGFTPAVLEKQLPNIQKALLKTPSASYTEGLQLQTQLASSGFKAEDVKSGAALQATLDLKAATNEFGEQMGDVKESIGSLSQFLKGMGIAEPTAEQIRKSGGKLTQVFEPSQIQFSDLKNLAPIAAGLKSLNIDETTQFAAFSAMVDTAGGENAATYLKQTASGLRSASFNKQGQEGLDALKLKGEDIDLIGEDFPTALERLKGALSKVDERTQSKALSDIFGERVAPNVQTFMTLIGTIRERMKSMEGNAFERNIGTFQESVFARRQRQNLRRTFAQRDAANENGGLTFDELREAGDRRIAELQNETDAKGRFALGIASWIGRAGLAISEGLGMRPADLGVTGPEKNRAAGLKPEAQQEAMEVQKQQLQELQKLNANRPPVNRNANTEK